MENINSVESQVINFLTAKAYLFQLCNEIVAGIPDERYFASTQELLDACRIEKTAGAKNAFRELLNQMAREQKIRFHHLSKPATHLWFVTMSKNLNTQK